MTLGRIVPVVAGVTALVTTTAVPAAADSIRDKEWHLGFLHVTDAHKVSQGDGIVVAVVDTGVDMKSAELRDAVLPGLTTAAGQSGDGRDDVDGHGTAMAALIAGRGKGSDGGVLGMAPRAVILPIRADVGGLMGTSSQVAPGIDWAVDHGAKVISIALGTTEDPGIRRAVERALAADVVVVAAVGNTPNQTAVAFPARIPGVVAVGGVDRQGGHAEVSTAGPETVLTAPAVDIFSIGLDARYLTLQGTSASTAIVAGTVALVRAKYPELKASEVVRRLAYTAQDKGEPGRDPVYGYGVVDPLRALTAEVPPPASPGVSPSATGKGEGGNGVAVIAAVGAAAVVVVFIGVLQSIIRGRRRR